eukprot:1139889-Pelagomonas_calceolata.AAC.3
MVLGSRAGVKEQAAWLCVCRGEACAAPFFQPPESSEQPQSESQSQSQSTAAHPTGVLADPPDGDRLMVALVGDEHILSETERGDSEGPISGQTSVLSGRCASLLNSCTSRNMDSSCTASMGCCCCCWDAIRGQAYRQRSQYPAQDLQLGGGQVQDCHDILA